MSYSHEFAALLNLKFKDNESYSCKVFSVQEGKKYDRIVQETPTGSGTHVHAFVLRETGEVFKAATWRAPAKDARFSTVQEAAEAADEFGSYLYK